MMSFELDPNNTGMNNWLVVKSPDDLFKLGIDIDFEKLNYKPLLINSAFNAVDNQ